MPHLYSHKTHGWQIQYRVYFLDGADKKKVRWSRSKDNAMDIYADVSRLESLSRRNSLTADEISYAFKKGYLDNKDVTKLSASHKGQHTWNELRKKYEDWSRAHCRKTTHAVNMLRIGKVIEYVEEREPVEWKEEDIRLYVQKRKASGAKDWTVRHEMVMLRRLFDYLGGDNPARKMPLVKANDEVIPRVFTRKELALFMRLVKKRRSHIHGYLRPVTLTYLYAGLRPSEIVRLTPRDVQAGKLMVQGATKTGRPRSVEIHPKLAVHINACLRKGGKYLFGGDTQLRPETISLTLRRIINDEEVGLEGVTPYSLRHTFVTELLRAGADLRYVMDKAGHKKLTTTTRYLHSVEDEDSPVRKIRIGKKESAKVPRKVPR